MSLAGLVAYGSSGESDTDDDNEAKDEVDKTATVASKQKTNPVINSTAQSVGHQSGETQAEVAVIRTVEARATNCSRKQDVEEDPLCVEDEDCEASVQQSSHGDTSARPSMFANLPVPQQMMPSTLAKDDAIAGDPLAHHRGKHLLKRRKNSPKKMGKHPVKITLPSLSEFQEEVEEEKVAKRKVRPSQKGSGLFSLLPAPKHISVKEANRSLIPDTLRKRPPTLLAPASVRTAQASSSVARGKNSNGEDAGEDAADSGASDFFMLKEKKLVGVQPTAGDPEVINASHPPVVSSIVDSPLHFADKIYSQGITAGFNQYRVAHPSTGYSQQAVPAVSGSDSEQNICKYYEDAVVGVTPTSVAHGSQDLNLTASQTAFCEQVEIDDEALLRLQGKKRHLQEEIKFIDVNEDAIRSDPKDWMTKQLTEEKETRSYSHRKNEGPTSQQKRKHQITYLAFQAKEKELELKNQWANNRLTKAQTQAKYGF